MAAVLELVSTVVEIYLADPHWSSLRSLGSSGDSNLGFRL